MMQTLVQIHVHTLVPGPVSLRGPSFGRKLVRFTHIVPNTGVTEHRHLFHWRLTNTTRNLTRDRTPLASMAYISINSLFTLIVLISSLCRIFLFMPTHSQQLTLGLIVINCTLFVNGYRFPFLKTLVATHPLPIVPPSFKLLVDWNKSLKNTRISRNNLLFSIKCRAAYKHY